MLLSDAIDAFLTYRRATYKPSSTRSADASLRQFLAITGNIQTKNLAPRHAEMFQTQMMTSGKKPNTVNARMSQLSSFNKWLQANRLCPVIFTGTTRSIPVPRRPRLRVPATDFLRLLDAAGRPDRRMIVAIGLFLFLRSSELQTLRVGDVDLQAGKVSVVIHKTNDWDLMPISSDLDAELRRWMVHYAADIGRPLLPSDFLVPAHVRYPAWNGPPLPRDNYVPTRRITHPYRHVQAVLRSAGFHPPEGDRLVQEGMHTLRRSGARALYDALVDGLIGDSMARDDALRQVMTMLHHASTLTTERYIGLERDRQRRDITLKGKSFLPPRPENVLELRKAVQ